MAASGGGGGGGAAAGRAYSFKVVLLGEGCVGKTSLVLRYCENKFNDKHITTLQVRAPGSGRGRRGPGAVRTWLPWAPGSGLTNLRPVTSAFELPFQIRPGDTRGQGSPETEGRAPARGVEGL